MAEPGAPFQSTDVLVTPHLPGRRMLAAWTLRRGDATSFVWHASVPPPPLQGFDDLRKRVAHGGDGLADDLRFY